MGNKQHQDNTLYSIIHLLICPGADNIILSFRHYPENFSYLFNGFSGTINDFRITCAHFTVMINPVQSPDRYMENS